VIVTVVPVAKVPVSAPDAVSVSVIVTVTGYASVAVMAVGLRVERVTVFDETEHEKCTTSLTVQVTGPVFPRTGIVVTVWTPPPVVTVVLVVAAGTTDRAMVSVNEAEPVTGGVDVSLAVTVTR
jgi:hypothetical protein